MDVEAGLVDQREILVGGADRGQTRDQQQAVADTIFGRIRALYSGLDADLRGD